jgi:anaerobic C4-dicarboxylate transporter
MTLTSKNTKIEVFDKLGGLAKKKKKKKKKVKYKKKSVLEFLNIFHSLCILGAFPNHQSNVKLKIFFSYKSTALKVIGVQDLSIASLVCFITYVNFKSCDIQSIEA